MATSSRDRFSAGEQGLGYIYQSRLALLTMLESSEDVALLLEGEDDLEFTDVDGTKSLASLKHKAEGQRLPDLGTDFWKSVRIWIKRYKENGKALSNLRFILFTTSSISEGSFLENFRDDKSLTIASTLAQFEAAMASSSAAIVNEVKEDFLQLTLEERSDFLGRVAIFDSHPRITDIPSIIIRKHFRSINRSFREKILERLEGWWTEVTIQLLSRQRRDPVFGYEMSDKLSSITEEYRSDNLPIEFRNARPGEAIDPLLDTRFFVRQLHLLDISMDRVQSAILDYFRSFEQRSSWARENLLISGEIEEYEDRLVEEWSRYKEIILDDLDGDSSEETLREAGRQIYRWAMLETGHLRIRERVGESYVIRGAFQILANNRPSPRVHWHPQCLQRIQELLEEAR